MPFRNTFEATDAAGSRLSIRDGPQGGAFVTVGEGGNFPRVVFLRPDAVRQLRDWCNQTLERAAPTLPVPAADAIEQGLQRW